jgi:hypothetical protein
VWAREGFATTSLDNNVFVFGCYNAPVGTPVLAPGVQRVIARVYASGRVDTTLALTDLPVTSIFGSVATLDAATGFWLTTASYAQTNAGTASPSPVALGAGVRYWCGAPATCPNSVALFDAYPINSISIGNTTIWASKNSLPGGGGAGFRESYAAWGAIGVPGTLPTAATTGSFQAYNSETAFSLGAACQSVSQSATSYWVAGCGNTAAATFVNGALVNMQSAAGTNNWFPAYTGLPAGEIGFRALTGKTIAGVFTLFLLNEPPIAGTTYFSRIYTFNTLTQVFSVPAFQLSANNMMW